MYLLFDPLLTPERNHKRAPPDLLSYGIYDPLKIHFLFQEHTKKEITALIGNGKNIISLTLQKQVFPKKPNESCEKILGINTQLSVTNL